MRGKNRIRQKSKCWISLTQCKTKMIFLLLTIGFAFFPVHGLEQGLKIVKIIARANDLQTGKFLYTEEHNEYWKNKIHLYSIVRYLRPDNTLIAEKKISFGKSKIAPDYQFKDLRDGYEERMQRISATSARIGARRKSNTSLKERTIVVPTPMVADGGFDYFIREYWSSLEKQAQVVSFVVPIENDYFRFKIYKVTDLTFSGVDAVKFRMQIDSALLNIFAESIDVIYDKRSQRLLHYRGISNINDETGRSYRVKIDFDYSESKTYFPSTRNSQGIAIVGDID